MTGVKGKIKWFDEYEHSGIITMDNGEEVLVYQPDVLMIGSEGRVVLEPGVKVEFDIRAVNVKVIEEE